MSRAFFVFPLLIACGGEVVAPTAESCAAICAADAKAPAPAPEAPAAAPAPAGGNALSAYETQILGPVLQDLREGVRPYDAKSVGICKGKDKCNSFVGTDAKDLPAGDYILQAVLAVPVSGEGWTVDVATSCTTEKDGNTSTNENSKTHEVKYPGPDRGYNLVPLRRIQSPGKHGKQSCTYKITAPHPDGDKVYEGSWNTAS